MDYTRFWGKVEVKGQDDCWEWQAYRDKVGYGRFWDEGKMRKSHRLSLSTIEPPPFKGAHVMHVCDNPPCCNPFHLNWCTPQANNDDKKDKGRQYKGESHHNSRYTNEIADEILKLKMDGLNCGEIAQKMGLKESGVMNVYIGRSWKHRHGVDGNPTTEQIAAKRPRAFSAGEDSGPW